jgi:hypothetical protein
MNAAGKSALNFAYEYVFTTVPINQIQDEVYETLKKLLMSLADTATALVYVVVYVSLVLAKLTILVFPHAVNLGKIIVEFHQTKLSRSDLILEGTSIVFLVTCFIFRAKIQRAWKSMMSSISAKSKVAAKAAPHVAFFTAAITFAILGRNFLVPLTHSAVMPVFTLLLPLAATIRVLLQMKTMDEASCQKAIYAKNLLWVIVAIYHALVTFGSLIPFSGRMLKYLPYAKEMVIVVIAWVQLSPVFSEIVFESVISKIMVKLCGMVPAGYGLDQADAKTSTFFAVLKMMYIVNDTHVAFLQALFQDGVATIIAVIFIFTPDPLASVGMVIIALLLPAFRTSAVVASASRNNAASQELAKLARPSASAMDGGKKAASSSAVGVDNVLSTHWLRYWVCLSVLWCVRIYLMRLWPSIVIVSTLWLQHSFFQGSSKLTAFLVDTAKALAERNKRIEMERALLSPSATASGDASSAVPGTASKTPSRSGFSFAAMFSPTPARKADEDRVPVTDAVASTPQRTGRSTDSKDRLERNQSSSSGSGGSMESEGKRPDEVVRAIFPLSTLSYGSM